MERALTSSWVPQAAAWPSARLKTSPEHWDRETSLNQRSVFFLLQKAAQRLRDNGRIIVLLAAWRLIRTWGQRCTRAPRQLSRFMCERWLLKWALGELLLKAVAPGLTNTASMRAVVPEARLSEVIAKTPLGRLGEPEDIADVVAFLASRAARWITSQVFRVNGGIVT